MNGDIKQHLQQIVRVICHSIVWETRTGSGVSKQGIICAVLIKHNVLGKIYSTLCVLNINGQISL